MLSQKKLRKSLGMEEKPTCAKCPLAQRCEVKDSSHLQLLAKKRVVTNDRYLAEIRQFDGFGTASLYDVNLLLIGFWNNYGHDLGDKE